MKYLSGQALELKGTHTVSKKIEIRQGTITLEINSACETMEFYR